MQGDEQMLSFVQKIISGRSNLDNLSHLFSIARREFYDLRSNGNMLLLSKPNTNAMKKSFKYRAAVIWNAQSLEDKIYELWNSVFLIVNSLVYIFSITI